MAMHGGAFNYGNAPIKIRRDSNYRSTLSQARNDDSVANAYIFGMQSAPDAGEEVSFSRHPLYANPNQAFGEVIDEMGNFRPKQDPAGGIVMSDPYNTTGYLAGGTSSTVENIDPRVMGQNAEMRIASIQNGRQFPGYNNRAQINRA